MSEKKLVIFDIDGTIIDSIKCDDACYVEALEDLYKIELTDFDWNQLTDITDTGITIGLFELFLERTPSKEEIEKLKKEYHLLLQQRIKEVYPIEGAKECIDYLKERDDIAIAFATGGWRINAILKSSVSGIDVTDFVFKTSDDHYNRAEIIKLAKHDCLKRYGVDSFERTISIGDGMWDMTTAEELDIDFVGVDYHGNQKLKNAGAKKVFKDYKDLKEVLRLLEL